MLHKGKLLPARALWLLVYLSLILLPASVYLGAQGSEAAAIARLDSSQLNRGRIELDVPGHNKSFRMKIDPEIYAIRLSMQAASADLDLVVSDLEGRELWVRNSPEWNESLFLYRMGTPSLEDGEYLVTVRFSGDYRPAVKGQLLDAIDFDVAFQVMRGNQAKELATGLLHTERLDPADGMQQSYKVMVPAGSKQLRVDVFGSQTDTDIYGQARQAFSDPRSAGYAAQTWRSRETLIIPIPKTTPLKSGAMPEGPVPVYVMILSEMDEVPTDFQIIASVGAEVPRQLMALPKLDSPAAGGLAMSIGATVEIITDSGGGSGCVISPEGWILTNYHVLRGNGGTVAQRVSIGFSQDTGLVPDTQFWADLSAFDEERDLALLQITSGFYTQALPAGYRFPYMKPALSTALAIGDALFFTGYPTIGGLGNRATITCTAGMVSGFQERNGIRYIKSAAVISSGNSGGAALDKQGHLVGIPTMVVGSESSQLAYVSSIETVPASWLKLAGVALDNENRNSQP